MKKWQKNDQKEKKQSKEVEEKPVNKREN
jgi:hypothetical protein